MSKMENYYGKTVELKGGRDREVYVPVWAQTLIDLYVLGLRNENGYEIKSDRVG